LIAAGGCDSVVKLATQWDFAYDGDGVRTNTLTTSYDENGLPQTPTLTSYYFGGAYEVRSDGATVKYYSFAGQTVAMKDASGLQYFLTDHLGSIVAVTDDTGTLTSQQRYLPFGGVRQLSNYSTIQQTDYGYTGQRLLDAGMGGLMDYKARFYSPLLGRFTQPDNLIPDLGNPQAWNRFSYVGNNPVRYNDPTGHMICEDDPCKPSTSADKLPKPAPGPDEPQTSPSGGISGHREEEGGGWGNLTPAYPDAVRQTNDYTKISLFWPILTLFTGVTIQGDRDRYGNWYAEVGPWIGTSPGFSMTEGYIGFGLDKIQSESYIENFIMGWSRNLGVGAIVGGGLTWGYLDRADLNAFAGEGGASTPGINYNRTYGLEIYDNGSPTPWIWQGDNFYNQLPWSQ
jgi:RHS repeat-associated protein